MDALPYAFCIAYALATALAEVSISIILFPQYALNRLAENYGNRRYVTAVRKYFKIRPLRILWSQSAHVSTISMSK